MHREDPEEWHSTQLSKLSRGLRFFGAALYLTFVMAVMLFADPSLTRSVLGFVILSALALVAVYDFFFILKRGVRWNAKGIQQTGTLLPSPVQNWEDLSSVLPNMHKRATVFTFKGMKHVKVYWGFDRHREIYDYAKERMENARTP